MIGLAAEGWNFPGPRSVALVNNGRTAVRKHLDLWFAISAFALAMSAAAITQAEDKTIRLAQAPSVTQDGVTGEGQVPEECRVTPEGEMSPDLVERCDGVLKPPAAGSSDIVKPPPATGDMPVITPESLPEQQPRSG